MQVKPALAQTRRLCQQILKNFSLVAQVFNLCTRTGKKPVPPKIFQGRQSRLGLRPSRK